MFNKSNLFFFAILLSFSLTSNYAVAQSANLDEVVVSANPLEKNSKEFARPAKVLKNEELNRKNSITLGETLKQELGVHSSFYGAGASRPIIRGLDGDNIAILQNSISVIDASAASPDHNISIDPFSAEKIEIIRGPQALFYGSKAIGGVVNILDSRIIEEQQTELVSGEFNTRYNTGDRERTAGIKLKGGEANSGLNYYFSGVARDTDNYDINGFARSEALRIADPLADEVSNKLLNSQTDSVNGTFGISKVYDDGFLGVSYSALNNNYGIPVEPEEGENIQMKSRRFDVSGGNEKVNDTIKKLTYKIGFTDYNHTEFEGNTPETSFKNNGFDGRIELTHNPINGFQGAVGLQSTLINASAVGEDPFVPLTKTLTNSAFIYEELPFDRYSLMFGGRADYQQAESEGGATFGNPQDRNDLTFSGSTGIKYFIDDVYTSNFNLSYTERAPNQTELYANGPHGATSTFEVGDANLDIQRSFGADLSFKKEVGELTGELNLFYNRFQNYIFLNPTGVVDGGSGYEIFNFTGVPAEFFGFELASNYNLINEGNNKLDSNASFDYVQAENTRTGQNLPRISPMRVGAGLAYTNKSLIASVQNFYVFEQDEIAANETKTDGYNMLNLALDYNLSEFNLNPESKIEPSIYLQANNILDEEARVHNSFIKDSAPLMGRNYMMGLRSRF
ncbi:MAG: TonB-dependent receptor [Rickettsiales bacterium]|nr:TonB-dependent receptor [Rickettsiales bacterium]